MLSVKGAKVLDSAGREVILRGYNIGNWMMLENFMMGFPGVEQEFRLALYKRAGEEKYRAFFDAFLDSFFGEQDAAYLEQCGVNCIRVPLNYRSFERDSAPFVYREETFQRLDALIERCEHHGIYVIFDMHAIQGYQSPFWHCDNNSLEMPRFFCDPQCRERFIRLWAAIAERYKDKEIVAGYDLINEPEAADDEEVAALNIIYRECAAAIRQADKHHILCIAGNRANLVFDVLDTPFAGNMIYTCHQYMDFLTSAPARYPDFDRNTLYNKAFISQQLDARDEFMRKHGVPCWMGEFGMRLNVEGYTEYRLRAFADMLDLLNERGCHFSIWSYKDIGLYGTVQLKPDAPWMLFIRDTLKIKQRYHLDTHVRADDDWGLGSILSLGDPDGFSDQTGRVKNAVTGAIKAVLSRELADRLAIRMARLSAKELSTLGQSFSYDYCFIDEKREDVINRHGFLK